MGMCAEIKGCWGILAEVPVGKCAESTGFQGIPTGSSPWGSLLRLRDSGASPQEFPMGTQNYSAIHTTVDRAPHKEGGQIWSRQVPLLAGLVLLIVGVWVPL